MSSSHLPACRSLPRPSARTGRTAGALLALALGAATGPAGAQDAAAPLPPATEALFVPSLPKTVSGVPGTWDLSRDGSLRRCVMTLAEESGPAGRRLRYPAGCRRALPILGAVAGWLFTDAGLRLVDKDLRPILMFGRRPDQRSLLALAQTGETYSLVPLDIVAMAPPKPAGEAAAPDAAAPDSAALRSTPEFDAPTAPPLDGATTGTVPPAASPKEAGPMPGRPGVYALDRYREKDVCRIDLAAGAAPAPARILEGCRDSGLAVFDPVSWSFAKGRLTLNARRGHTVELVPMGEGAWRREPETGTTFVLRRIEP
ncbi:AprI/Inh family metalloprotease inhibitor [Methylobacterium sp. sgz302541]|uniref:AprI/Inh family metalloprotease inhibitor n=1 Tax=unclassified Methylobacterium TaxID=2615210 RepID=UPI003D331FAB